MVDKFNLNSKFYRGFQNLSHQLANISLLTVTLNALILENALQWNLVIKMNGVICKLYTLFKETLFCGIHITDFETEAGGFWHRMKYSDPMGKFASIFHAEVYAIER